MSAVQPVQPIASGAFLRGGPGASMQRDSRAWQLQSWISFGIAVLVCGTGLAYLPGHALDRAFMVMGYAFCLVLAKMLRDRHEADLAEGRTGRATRQAESE